MTEFDPVVLNGVVCDKNIAIDASRNNELRIDCYGKGLWVA